MANWAKLAVSFSVAAQNMAQPNTQKRETRGEAQIQPFILRPTMGAATSVSSPTGATASPAQVAV